MKSVENYLKESNLRAEYESLMEHRKWAQQMPKLKLDPDWEIKIIPPFGGAVVRFVIIQGDKSVSVYLDCYGLIGCIDHPYWEIYPDKEGDVERYDMDDIEGLINGIRESLKSQS